LYALAGYLNTLVDNLAKTQYNKHIHKQEHTMKTAVMIFAGIVTTMAGVGGIEQSMTTPELLSGLLVAVTGLGIMGCAVLMIKREEANEY
jgi:uncharacterized membrane protein